jgi:hypothetical protein
MSLKVVFTQARKQKNTCRCCYQCQFEEIGSFLLKLHRSAKTPDHVSCVDETLKWCLHKRENIKYLSMLLVMAISGDRNFSIEIALLSKNDRPISLVYTSFN